MPDDCTPYDGPSPDSDFPSGYVPADAVEDTYWRKTITDVMVNGHRDDLWIDVKLLTRTTPPVVLDGKVWKEYLPQPAGIGLSVHEGDRVTDLLVYGWLPKMDLTAHALSLRTDMIFENWYTVDTALNEVFQGKRTLKCRYDPGRETDLDGDLDEEMTAVFQWLNSLMSKAVDVNYWTGPIPPLAVILVRQPASYADTHPCAD